MICKSRELQYIRVQTLDKYCKFGGIKGDPSKKNSPLSSKRLDSSKQPCTKSVRTRYRRLGL